MVLLHVVSKCALKRGHQAYFLSDRPPIILAWMIEARRYRLYLTPDQEARAAATAGACRAVFNAALEQRQSAYRLTGRSPGYTSQCRDLTDARREIEWLAEAPAQALQQSLRDLNGAFERFFAGQGRYPRFRSKGARESFRLPQGRDIAVRRLNRRWGEVRLAKLGWSRFRFTRPVGGQVRHATVARDALGWHISLCVETPRELAKPNSGSAIGLDLGVTIAIADSDGGLNDVPGLGRGEAERLRRLERKAGRQEAARRRRSPGERRRSRRHQRTLDSIARLKAREARIRKDCLHRISCQLAKNHGLIAIEQLSVGKMTRSARGTIEQPGRRVRAKAGLNRAILRSGWGELHRQLAYKADWYGATVKCVSAAYTSQTCAECGHVDARSRRSRNDFACLACGHHSHADVNAARVILARAIACEEDGGRIGSSQHGEPSSRKAGHGTVNHPGALAA